MLGYKIPEYKRKNLRGFQTKSAIISDNLQVQHYARSRASQIIDTNHFPQHSDNI